MVEPKPARVLVVDDHAIVRFGLLQVLQSDPRFVICGEAANALEARQRIATCRADVAIVDLVLGGRDGIGLLGEICRLGAGLRVLVFSAQPELVYAPRVFRAGACGYLMKDAGVEKVPEALAAVLRGEPYASATVQRAMFQKAAAASGAASAAVSDDLSDRELQVLGLLGAGYGTGEIAAQLSLSIKTIGTYRERLKLKLGLDDARQLDRRAVDFVRTGKL